MLDENPSLLLQSGNVKTPGGDEWNQVTIYEFLLGAGDYQLVKLVQDYFAKIEGGEEERVRQYERYRPHMEDMLTQKPYDLSPIIELIKKAPAKEIKALLNKDMSGNTELCQAMLQFRKDWAPKVLSKPGMHYNYASLKHAIMIITDEWKNLYKDDDNYDKLNFVLRQLIGFEMRRLPGVTRCMMAQGYIDDSETFKCNDEDAAFSITDSDDSFDGLGSNNDSNNDWRSYTFKYNDEEASFPITDNDDTHDGLGWDFIITALMGFTYSLKKGSGDLFTIKIIEAQLCAFKEFKELIQPQPAHQSSEDNLLQFKAY
jgi:hypothetical protein